MERKVLKNKRIFKQKGGFVVIDLAFEHQARNCLKKLPTMIKKGDTLAQGDLYRFKTQF